MISKKVEEVREIVCVLHDISALLKYPHPPEAIDKLRGVQAWLSDRAFKLTGSGNTASNDEEAASS
jgi:hypothetical protein